MCLSSLCPFVSCPYCVGLTHVTVHVQLVCLGAFCGRDIPRDDMESSRSCGGLGFDLRLFVEALLIWLSLVYGSRTLTLLVSNPHCSRSRPPMEENVAWSLRTPIVQIAQRWWWLWKYLCRSHLFCLFMFVCHLGTCNSFRCSTACDTHYWWALMSTCHVIRSMHVPLLFDVANVTCRMLSFVTVNLVFCVSLSVSLCVCHNFVFSIRFAFCSMCGHDTCRFCHRHTWFSGELSWNDSCARWSCDT